MQQQVIKLKPGDGDRSPERMASAAAIEAHRKAKQELQDCNDAIEKAQENAGGLYAKLARIQEDARATKLAGYIPPSVAAVRERIQTCQPLPRMHNEHNAVVAEALASMEPPLPGEEEKQLQAKIDEWRVIAQAQENRLDDLERKVTWSKLAIAARASEVLAAIILTKDCLRQYELDRSRVEQKGGGLRFVQSKLADGAINREIGVSMRGLNLHPRGDLAAAFDALCIDADAQVPAL